MDEKIHRPGKFFIFDRAYISEFVYGGIDGIITTFAVVSGAVGANLDISIILILGFANLIADGFSMSVGNFFATKAERKVYDKHVEIEYWEIENLREKEVEEIREIYAAKGFKGQLLEQVVEVITSDKDVWVDTMMKEELEMVKDDKTPVKTAFMTFLSFNLIGLIPLMTYLFSSYLNVNNDTLFLISCLSTAFGLGIIGNLKAMVTEQNKFKSIMETMLLGGIAASLAYFVGDILERLVS